MNIGSGLAYWEVEPDTIAAAFLLWLLPAPLAPAAQG